MKTYPQILILFLLVSINTNAQNNTWSLPQVYFNNQSSPSTLTQLPIPPYLYGDPSIPLISGNVGLYEGYTGQEASNASNMIAKDNGEILFFIVDEYIYNKNGYCIGVMSYTSSPIISPDFKHVDGATEITIVQNPSNCEQYYIISTFLDPISLEKTPYIFLLDMGIPNSEACSYSIPEVVYGQLVPIGPTSGSGQQLIGLNIASITPNFQDPIVPTSNVFIAATDKNSNNEHLIFISNGNGIYKYKIDPNGFSFTGNFISFGPIAFDPAELTDTRSEMEIVELNNGNFRIACPYKNTQQVGSNTAWEFLFVAELDLFGNFIPTTDLHFPFYKNNLIPNQYIALKGLEFSIDGNILYLTHSTYSNNPLQPNQIEYFDFNNPSATLTPLLIPTNIDAKFSMLEIDQNGSIYFNGANGMYKIPNANTPNTNLTQVLLSPGSYNFGFYNPSGIMSDLHKLYTLPDQIDNLEYSNLQTIALACCLKSKNYDIDYFNTSGTNVWQPGTPTTFSANLPTTIYIGKELKIKAGSTLTLNNMILKFSPEARLVVENGDGNLQGGILILNNTKLTVDDECDPNNLLWLGVEVWGNQNMLQGSWLNSNQGRLQLTNNSIIEHAFIGALIGKRTTLTTTICNNFNEEEIQSFNFDDNRNGGIIQVVNNSMFSQNQRGIWMRPYISPAALPNLSMAKNSNFKWQNNLNGGVNIQAHVTLESVKGVNFEGVNFENNIAANSSQFGMGIGVLSRSAQFTINRSCPFITTLYGPCPGEIKSLFKNLEFGIHATNNSDNLTFSVTNSEFKECKAGIHTIGTQNERIVRNTFFIREAQYNTVGISLFNSTGYRVMENNLLGNSSLPGQGMSYGIVAENSGTAPNLIYKNSFRELFVGGYSIKVNGSLIDESNFPNYMSSTGLKWKCNQFSSIINSYDLAINGRIDYNQGYAINFTSTDARNSAIANNFSLNLNAESLMNPVPLEHDIFVTNNSQPLRYVHLSDLNQIPDYYTLNKVAPIPASFLGIPILSQNKTCKSKLGKTTIQLVADLINAKNQIIDLKSTIDQGNSSFLFTLINSSSNPISIKNELILKSPFLSDSLLLTYLNSNAPSAFKKDVLLSNSTLTNYVLNAVINSNLPNGTKNQIINAQNGVSLKEQTFMSIDFYQSEFQDNYDEILSRLLLDTSSTAGYSEVINFLNSINDVKSKKTLTDIYLSLNDVQNMDNVKTSLQSEIVDPDYFELQNIKEQLKAQVSINYAIENSSSVVSQIENLALNSTNLHVKAKSKTLLEFRDDYSPLPDFLPLFTSNMIIEQNDIIEVPQNNNYEFVSMYPNPSEGFVYFDYPEITAGKLEVQLIDVNGKVIYTYVSLSDTNGEIVDLNHIENGFYIVNIIIDGLSIETKKLLLK